MKRRRCLLASGSVILGTLGLGSLGQEPVVGLEFEIVDVEQVAAGSVSSVTIDFERFKLIPRYVSGLQDAEIKIMLDVDGEDRVISKSTVQLENGQEITRDDISDSLPISRDGINVNSDFVTGDVIIEIDHPDISDQYKQSFSISDVDLDLYASDLSAWWKLDGTSDTAVDSTDNNYDGTLYGDIQQGLSGKGGLNSYGFDSSNDYVSVSNGIGDASSSGWSLCAWIKLDTLPTSMNSTAVVADIEDSQPCGIEAYIGYNNTTGDADRVAIRARGSGGPDGWGQTDLTTGTWYHITTIVYSNGDYDVYLDGEKDTENFQNSDMTNTGGGSSIGATGSGGNNFPGQICDLRIYDTALTGEQVQTIYDQGSRDDLDDATV